MTFLFLDTSTSLCRVIISDGDSFVRHEWLAERNLADGLLGYLESLLQEHEMTWNDLDGIGVFRGPGSFTGLRIGLTVANTLSNSLEIPIVGETGTCWLENAKTRLETTETDTIVLPLYDRDANVTKPRK